MIVFSFDGREIQLPPGSLFSSAVGSSYQDASTASVRAVVASIRDGTPWRDAVRREYAQTHPWLFRIITSPDRDRFFREHPPLAGDRVLDVGAGWGQIALPLAHSNTVTVVEPTPERIEFIQAAAAQQGTAGCMHFIQAPLGTIRFHSQFDLIACIGVLEWVPKFQPGDIISVQIEFLKQCREILSPGGRLVIGIENRLGVKYLLGAPDDHIGVGGITVYDIELAARKWSMMEGGSSLRVGVHTQAEYRRMLTEAGFNSIRFFAAFPDYKVPEIILPADSPESLQQYFTGHRPPAEHSGADGNMLPFQRELASHYDSLSALGIVHHFAPSYFIEAS